MHGAGTPTGKGSYLHAGGPRTRLQLRQPPQGTLLSPHLPQLPAASWTTCKHHVFIPASLFTHHLPPSTRLQLILGSRSSQCHTWSVISFILSLGCTSLPRTGNPCRSQESFCRGPPPTSTFHGHVIRSIKWIEPTGVPHCARTWGHKREQ